MVNLNPKYLVNKFLNSATLGQKYTERAKRLLTLIITPIWLSALILCTLVIVEGVKGFIYYPDSKELLNDLPLLQKNRVERSQSSFGETRFFQGIDAKKYQRVGIENVDSFDDTAPWRALRLQEARMYSLLYIPIVLTVFFLLPWLVLRLIYWIKKADNIVKI